MLVKIVDWVRTVCEAAKGLVVPISGGSDSALCLWICARACRNVTGVYFGDKPLRSEKWFHTVAPIEVHASLDTERSRWSQLMALRERRWIVGSRNHTEDILGTYSVDSMCATVLPIVGLYKCDVLQSCEKIGAPDEIMASSRMADPECGRPQKLADIPLELIDEWVRLRRQHECNSNKHTDAPPGMSIDQHSFLCEIYQRNRFKRSLPLRYVQ